MEVVGAVLVRDGRVLVGLRAGRGWEFPGGKLEPGEGPADALLRECREELGVDVIAIRDLGGTTGDGVGLRLWLAELAGPAPTASTDHAELRWAALDDLDELDWLPLDAELLSVVRPLLG